MEAQAKIIVRILNDNDQYIVPLFQRSYSWQKDNWVRLFNDINALMEDDKRPVHFLGPLVCTPVIKEVVPDSITCFQLIDGQQRLTTLTVILAALRDVSLARGYTKLAEKIKDQFLVHRWEQGINRFKVLPRTGDREALEAIIDGEGHSRHSTRRIIHAWRYFRRQIKHGSRTDSETYLTRLLNTVSQRLALVVITIHGENPYEIFESLNAAGLPLEESDLIRNFVFMQVPLADQLDFDATYWSPVEKKFESWGNEKQRIMTACIRDYLMCDGIYSREDSTFIDFKERQTVRELTPVQQAEELKNYAPLYFAIRKPECEKMITNERLLDVLKQIKFMDMGTAYPLILNLLNRKRTGQLADEAVVQCLSDLVSFVLRRTICNESTRAYGKLFIDAIGVLKSDPPTDLRNYLLAHEWPNDEAVVDNLKDFALYRREPNKTRLILQKLERSYGHKEAVPLENLTIEHVMPQTIGKDSTGDEWKSALGLNWEEEHSHYLHTLGNLTLTAYNTPLSNNVYSFKKTVYKDSNVILNKYFENIPSWNAGTIKDRTKYLASILCGIWGRPPSEIPYHGTSTPEEEKSVSSASKRNYEYWSQFFKEWGNNLGLDIKTLSNSVNLSLPLVANGEVTANLWTNRQQRKQVVYVEFKGKALKIFEQLRNRKQNLDDAIEGDLLWETPVRNSFSVEEDEIDFNDRVDWPIQHAWFYEELSDIIEALKPELALYDDSAESDQGSENTELHRQRLSFWTDLLLYAQTKTPLHANCSAAESNWIGGGIGRRGFGLNYSVREKESQVELYIDLGKGMENETKSAFHKLKKDQKAIEAEFGGSLDWQVLSDKRACRICKVISGGWLTLPEGRSETYKNLVDAMIRLDRSLRPYVHKLQV